MSARSSALMMLPLAAFIACHSDNKALLQPWTCPMHLQVTRDKPGDCPICGMKLVPARRDSPPVERKPLLYRNPMNPAITSPVPKKDEMGMDYVPVYAADTQPSGVPGMAAVTLDPAQRQLIGLKTVAVVRGTLAGELRTSARVAYDERRVQKVTARAPGFVENLAADFTGKLISKGDPLLSIYSPDLLSTQQEFLLAMKAHDSLVRAGLPDMVESARERLRLLGISDREIGVIAKNGKPIRALTLYAPISGFLKTKNVMVGARVEPNEALFEIMDLSRVWLLADVYEYELPRLRVGQAATFTLPYWPDRKWTDRISYIYPTVDEKTRTVRVRIEVANPHTDLKPEMFGDVVIATAPRTVLLIPDDAVINTGTRNVVFVALKEGKLQPREIAVGAHAGGQYEVRSGVLSGDRVAAGASFLLDSEAQLKAAVSAMAPTAEGAP